MVSSGVLDLGPLSAVSLHLCAEMRPFFFSNYFLFSFFLCIIRGEGVCEIPLGSLLLLFVGQ